MPIKLRPTSNRVAVIPESQSETSEGGIHIPSTAKFVPKMGTVFAIGPGRVVEKWERVEDLRSGSVRWHRMPMEATVGDRVFFASNAGTEIQIDRQTFLILRMDDILAFVEEEEEDENS